MLAVPKSAVPNPFHRASAKEKAQPVRDKNAEASYDLIPEHKIVVGVDDIKAVIIACACGIRLSMLPDDIHIPNRPGRR